MISKEEFATRTLFAKLIAIADGNFMEVSAQLDSVFWSHGMQAEQMPTLLKTELVNNLSSWSLKANLNFTAGLNNVGEWVQTQLMNLSEELKILKKPEYQNISSKPALYQNFLTELENSIFTKHFSRQFLTQPVTSSTANTTATQTNQEHDVSTDNLNATNQQIAKLSAEIQNLKELLAQEQSTVNLPADLPVAAQNNPVTQTLSANFKIVGDQLTLSSPNTQIDKQVELEQSAAEQSVDLARQNFEQAQALVQELRTQAEAAKNDARLTIDEIAREKAAVEQRVITAQQEINAAYSKGSALAQRAKSDVATALARVEAIETALRRAKDDLDAAYIAETSGSGSNIAITTAEARLKAMRIAADQAQRDYESALDAEFSMEQDAQAIITDADSRASELQAYAHEDVAHLEDDHTAALDRVQAAETALTEAEANANASMMILEAAMNKLNSITQNNQIALKDVPSNSVLSNSSNTQIDYLSQSTHSLTNTEELNYLRKQLADAQAKLETANVTQAEAITKEITLAKREIDAAERRAANALTKSEVAERRAAAAAQISAEAERELKTLQAQLEATQSRASMAEQQASSEHEKVLSAQKTIKELQAQQFRLQASLVAAQNAAKQAAAEPRSEVFTPQLINNIEAADSSFSNREQVKQIYKILKKEVDSSQVDQWNEEMIRYAEQEKSNQSLVGNGVALHEETILHGGTLNSAKHHLSASELDSYDDTGKLSSIFAPAPPRERRATQLLQSSAMHKPVTVLSEASNIQTPTNTPISMNFSADLSQNSVTSSKLESLQKVATLKTSDYGDQAQEIHLYANTGREIIAKVEKFNPAGSLVSTALELLLINYIGSLKLKHVIPIRAQEDIELNTTYLLLATCLKDAGLPMSITVPILNSAESVTALAQIKKFFVLPNSATTAEIGDKIIRYYFIGGWNVDNADFITFCTQLGYPEEPSYILQAGLKGDKKGLFEVMHNPKVTTLGDSGDLRYDKGYGAQLGPDFQSKMLQFSQIVKEAAGTKDSFIQKIRKLVGGGLSAEPNKP